MQSAYLCTTFLGNSMDESTAREQNLSSMIASARYLLATIANAASHGCFANDYQMLSAAEALHDSVVAFEATDLRTKNLK